MNRNKNNPFYLRDDMRNGGEKNNICVVDVIKSCRRSRSSAYVPEEDSQGSVGVIVSTFSREIWLRSEKVLGTKSHCRPSVSNRVCAC